MDSRMTYYFQAAAAAAHAAEGDESKLTPKSLQLKVEVQGIGLGDDADDDDELALPRPGKIFLGLGNGAAALGVDNDDRGGEGGVGARDLTCPECDKVFPSDKAMYGHLRCHPQRGYKAAAKHGAASVAGETKLPTMWPATAKRARSVPVPVPVADNDGSAAAAVSASSEEEEAAMILLGMSSRGSSTSQSEDLPMLVGDAVAAKEMPPGDQQLELPRHAAGARAMHLALDVEQPMIPDHEAGPVVGQHVPEPEKPAPPVEHVMETLADAEVELVSKLTEAPQMTEVEKPMQLEPITDAVLVVVRGKKGAAAEKQPLFPVAKQPKKRRPYDPGQSPDTRQASAADVMPPARRIPSPASNRR